jgi:hypothetical protein
MSIGTNLFKVTSIIKSEQNIELTVAIGLSTFGKATVSRNEKNGSLSLWEKMDSTNGSMGTAVVINKKDFAGFSNYNGDEFILIKIKTNIPFIYYAGAGWEKSKYFQSSNDWENYILLESKNAKF